MVRIINVCSGKGGVGKTTIAANLGVALQKYNKKVAVIDFNITTSHIGLYFDMYKCPLTLNNFLRNEVKLEDAIYKHKSGLNVVPASLRLDDIVNIDVSGIKEKLKQVFADYDIVILDSAPGLGKEAMIALQASDETLFVANPFIPSLVDIEKCKHVIEKFQIRPTLLGVIVNRVRNKKYELTMEEIQQFLEMPIIGYVPEDEEVLASFNKKELVASSKKKSPSQQAFFKLAAKIAGHDYSYSFWDKVKMAFKRKKEFA
ncbi:MAG: cell division ATPase MinD [Candidatus Aenigmarchaeota archaeon]|nr:cell division ATPase MinD [Candidatus Aenigmarchaeota archaeon]